MAKKSTEILQFRDVTFSYSSDKIILNKVSFQIMEGQTYALVGPTGGGKSTTAGLMARLFDPDSGLVEFKNRDIRTFETEELTNSIGFILQEPFLFSGTVGENIVYGNDLIADWDGFRLLEELKSLGFEQIVSMFENGLETMVSDNTENISLGQKQLISFMRILLRRPVFLIMDEATANIDTVTEKLLNDIIDKLPNSTTKVIIAHRLNTIKNADQILFINEGRVQSALDFDDAVNLIESGKRVS